MRIHGRTSHLPLAALACAAGLALAFGFGPPNPEPTAAFPVTFADAPGLTADPTAPGETAIHLLTAGHAGVGGRTTTPAASAAGLVASATAPPLGDGREAAPARSPAPPRPLHVLHCRWLI
jgi:hypothetical protein